MPCEVLGAGTAEKKQLRGQLYVAHDVPATWGERELNHRPHYFICTISDRNASEIQELFDHIYDSATDSYIGPKYQMTPAEVAKANGKSYTWAEFTSFLLENTVLSIKGKK